MEYNYEVFFATNTDTVKFECDSIDAVVSIIEMVDLYSADGEWKITIKRKGEKYGDD